MPHRRPDARDALQEGDGLMRSGLKLIHLKMIVALDETQMISAAASALNISQPAASRMIAEMEAIVKAPLCRRLPRGIALTPYGQSLARRALTVLLELRDADREIADLRLGRGGTVSIGAVTGPAIDLVVPAIKKLRAASPNVEINLQVETSPVMVRELLASRLDFMIGRITDDLDPRQFEIRTIGLEYARLIVRKGHPLLAEPTIALDALTAYDWVMQPQGSLMRRAVEAHFLAADVRLPEQVLYTSSILLTMIIVAESDAIAPVAAEAAEFIALKQGSEAGVVILPADIDIRIQPFSLIRQRGRSLSPAAELLYRQICVEAKLDPV